MVMRDVDSDVMFDSVFVEKSITPPSARITDADNAATLLSVLPDTLMLTASEVMLARDNVFRLLNVERVMLIGSVDVMFATDNVPTLLSRFEEKLIVFVGELNNVARTTPMLDRVLLPKSITDESDTIFCT